MAEPWPDLEGDCPDDWDHRQWVAAQAIYNGETQRLAAKRVGVAVGTVSRWKRGWKDRYGDEFLAGDKTRNLAETREIAAAYRRGTDNKTWAEVRASAASANGVTADLARQVAQAILIRYLESPEDLAALEVKDALTLAKVAEMLEKRADELIDIRRGQGPGSFGGQFDEVPEGIFDALDAPVGEEHDEVVAQAAENATTFLRLVEDSGLPPNGIIEIYETEDSESG